ncbi:MAG TPA: 4-hydroxy-3-methylbut-2-en-1-yl diphosphate synthase, partial [Solirubrobacterales bacterium]|nr:4-hydroxy-3-methylbut-2-en-1-yl diphosphate synthase [Solirubrobacterales bacterium]
GRGGKIEVDHSEAAEGAAWLQRIEEENAGDLTPEKLAAMEKAAAEKGEDITAPGDGKPYLKPVKGKKVELGEEASPTAGRRFTRA